MTQHRKTSTYAEETTVDWSMLKTEDAPDFGEWLTLDILKASGGKDLVDGMPRTLTVRRNITKEGKVTKSTTVRYVQVTPALNRLSAILSDAWRRGSEIASGTKLGKEYGLEVVGGFLSKHLRIILPKPVDQIEDNED